MTRRPPAEQVAAAVVTFMVALASYFLLMHWLASCDEWDVTCPSPAIQAPVLQPITDPAQPIEPAEPQAKGACTDCEPTIRTVPAGPSDLWT
jgi:hypothetical protein